jgi:thiol-disulfide isomerase/thioredoxin
MDKLCQLTNCMWFTKRLLILIGFCSLAVSGQGQNLKGSVSGFSGSSVMLSYFSGDQRFVVDTFSVRNGKFEISMLPYSPGFYSLIFDRDHFFDLYVYNGFPNSEFTAEYEKLDESMTWKGCQENEAFLKFRKKGIEVGNLVNSGSLSPENASGIFSSWEEQWATDHSELQIARFIGARDPMSSIQWDPAQNFQKWSAAYWKNCALDDPAMIRSPFLLRNMDFYFDKVCPPVPDSAVAALNVLFSQPIAPGVLDILVSKLTIRFEGSKVMGMDKAFVYMVDKFYRTGIASWESDENLQKIVRKADELSWNLLGSVAPDFEFLLEDDSKKKLSEFHRGKLHVLYFWDATCSHCQKTTPVLKSFYDKFKSQGVELIAVTTEADLDEWRTYIRSNGLNWVNGYDNRFSQITFRHYYYIPTTPLVMLLDGDGTILAKNISIEDLERIVVEQLNTKS